MSSYDDKRFLKNDGIKTLSHGHYSIKLNNELKKYYKDWKLMLRILISNIYI